MRIGVLTGGGDCPGLNAIIRAIVRKGEGVHGHEILGFRHGWRGVLENDLTEFTIASTHGILERGGTILGTSRTNPLQRDDGVATVQATLARERIETLITIGGEDTLGVAHQLGAAGIACIGVPKTIDNDVSATDVTVGFNTAAQIATDAIDRLRTTAESHDRVMIVEVMGRHAGWLALTAGVAGGANLILVPEQPFDVDELCEQLRHRHAHGVSFSIVVVAEGAEPVGGTMIIQEATTDEFGHQRLGGIGHALAPEIEARTGYEARATILGHVLRGGTPTTSDRILATRFGLEAVDAAHERDFGTMVALRGTDIVRVPIADGVRELKLVPPALLESAAVFFG